MFLSKPSQASEAAIEDRRRSVRHPTVHQVAKLRLASGREELCLLRDISAEGLKAEVYIPLEPGASIDIELRTAHNVRGRIVWSADNQIGVAFDVAIPAAAMLAHCSFEASGAGLRPPRLKVNLRGLLRVGADARMVSIGNISQAGLQIAAAEPIATGVQCSIVLPWLPARAASVCWWREGHAGLLLAEPLDYADFARWRSASR